MINFLKCTASILVCLAAGWIGSIFTQPAIPGWYENLNKPFYTPPNWIFAPVWTLLFILMGIALFLVWKSESRFKKWAIFLFFVQLGLNAAWSYIFFGLQSILGAFIQIMNLWLFIVLTMAEFRRICRPAAILFFPYFLWVSFAVILNLGFLRLNS